MKKGYLITFEGLDGSGKTTQINRLITRLGDLGYQVQYVREPGFTSLGEKVRDLLLNCEDLNINERAELFLFLAARAQVVSEVINPCLEAGYIVLCDRFIDSTIAYQGFGRGLNCQALDNFNLFATQGLMPDLTIWLDLDEKIYQERIKQRGLSLDRMEGGPDSFRYRVREGFRAIAEEDQTRNGRRIRRIDANVDIESISTKILNYVLEVIQ